MSDGQVEPKRGPRAKAARDAEEHHPDRGDFSEAPGASARGGAQDSAPPRGTHPLSDARDAHTSAGLDGSVRHETGCIEAVLLTSGRAVSAARLAAAIDATGSVASHRAAGGASQRSSKSRDASHEDRVAAIVAILNDEYVRTGRSFRIERVAGGYQIVTLGAFAPAVEAYQAARAGTRLSRAGVETLAIIAYRQPITRVQLESIRGVACGDVLKSLIERRLVTIAGRAEELGRPMLYATTRQFLETFGLASIKDLPSVEGMLEKAAAAYREDDPGDDDDEASLEVGNAGEPHAPASEQNNNG